MYGTRQDLEVVKSVAMKLCKKYKNLNQFDEEGKILGLGYYTFLTSIQQRYSYLARPEIIKKDNKAGPSKRIMSSSIEPVAKKRRTGPLRKTMESGCVNYNPTVMTDEDQKSGFEKMKWLKAQSQLEIRDESKVERLMKETFNHQRKFLTSVPLPHCKSILKDWPMMLKPKFLSNHFKMLCQINFSDQLLLRRFQKIYESMNNHSPPEDFLLKTMEDLFNYFKDGKLDSMIKITEVFYYF